MTQEWDAGRLDSDLEGVGFDTLAVRAGQHRTPEGEHGDPMFFTSSYVFRTAADAAARFAGEVPGNVYSRYTNPTVRSFEERIAALEGAEQAVADPAARQRDQIYECRVESVDGSGRLVVEAEAAVRHGIHHEQHEQRPHAVVAEALPHLGEEERVKPARVTAEAVAH